MSALARKIHSAEFEQVTLETPEPASEVPLPRWVRFLERLGREVERRRGDQPIPYY